jgi:hypothetical protein
MDYRTDNNPRGINFLVSHLGDDKPGYLTAKQAEEEVEPTKFALETRKEYPYTTPRETWMSYAYLKTANTKLATGTEEFVDRRLRLASARFGIDDDLVEVDALVAEFKKEAAASQPMRKYALTIERGEESHNMYPVNSKAELRNSMSHIQNADALPIEWMKQACVALVDKAEEMGVSRNEIPEKVLQLGVRREPNFEKAAMVARNRGMFVKDREIVELYKEIVKSAAADDESQINRYIELWTDLDRAEGIKSYGKGIADPYTAFLSGEESVYIDKIASENVFLMNTLIPTEAFLNTKQFVHEKFSKKAAENIISWIDEHGHDGVALSRKLKELPLDSQRDLAQLLVKRA